LGCPSELCSKPRFSLPGENWQRVAEGLKSARGPAFNSSGEISFAYTAANKIRRIGLDGKVSVFAEVAGQAHCITWYGRFLAVDESQRRPIVSRKGAGL